MELAMIGLGRMGLNMARRLLRGGHRVVVHNRSDGPAEAAVADGAERARSIAEVATKLKAPRAAWVMLPSGDPTEGMVHALLDVLSPGDTIVDGGNSDYRDSIRRAGIVGTRGLHLVDVGTSGGIWGLTEGYSLMVGGDEDAVRRLAPALETLAPGADRGWGRVGPSGAGHFVKMVHNGIEYGLMQAYAEGFSVLERKRDLVLDLHQVAEIWRSGSVVRSWLLDLVASALAENPDLHGIAPRVADSGEGRWTVREALALDVPAPVITISLLERLRSREENSFGDRLLAVMRSRFGGHEIKRGER